MPILSRSLSVATVAVLAGCSGEPETPQPPPAPPAPEQTAVEAAASPGDHVSFFVIGKAASFDQDAAGNVTLVDVGYFGEIFKTVDGEVTDASMRLDAPGAKPIPYDDEGDGGLVLYGMSGVRHATVEALEAELPNGDYVFRMSTPAGDVEAFDVSLGAPGSGTDLPPAPVIGLSQAGETVANDAVMPGTDLLVSWTPFDTGRADPNGIADDLIFVQLNDCLGERAFHSGRPLGSPNPLAPDRPSDSLLTYSDDDVIIPGNALRPGLWYTLKVEHARLLDTDRRQGVVGMSTFAVTTRLPVQVTGDAPPGGGCPDDD
jgi:hypothetical protein